MRQYVNADVKVNLVKREQRSKLLEMVNFLRPFIKCQYFNDGKT